MYILVKHVFMRYINLVRRGVSDTYKSSSQLFYVAKDPQVHKKTPRNESMFL